MICLLDSFEVLCFHHDANFRIGSVRPINLVQAVTDDPKLLHTPYPLRRLPLPSASVYDQAYDREGH